MNNTKNYHIQETQYSLEAFSGFFPRTRLLHNLIFRQYPECLTIAGEKNEEQKAYCIF